MTPFEKTISTLDGVTGSGNDRMAKCPAHEDKRASLSVTEGRDGKVLLHCHAGCTFDEIVDAAGLTPDDLFPDGKSSKAEISAEYDYVDANGDLLYQSVRMVPKSFRQRTPDDDGGWTWSLKGVERTIYRLPAVLESARIGRPVFIVEGERDVHTLEKLGVVATCNSGGAGKWLSSFSKYFEAHSKGFGVVILPDNDEPGRDHARKIATFLHTRCPVKIVELDVKEKGDVTDWVRSGGTRARLMMLIKDTPAWTPTAHADPPEPPAGLLEDLHDTGNAARFFEHAAEDFLFVSDVQKWYTWNGRHWEQDVHQKRMAAMTETMRKMERQAKGIKGSSKKAALRHVTTSLNAGKLQAAVKLAEHLCSATNDLLDADPFLVNARNATLKITAEGVKKRAHKQSDYITQMMNVDYDPSAKAPRWLRFISEVLPDPDMAFYMQRIMGYALTGSTNEQAMFVLHGIGANGKSVLLDTVSEIVGTYGEIIRPEALLIDKTGSIPSDIAALRGVRYAHGAETELGARMAEGLIKSITGDKKIRARFMYADWFTFTPMFKLFLATNHKPVIKGTDSGIWRRIKLVSFDEVIPAEKREHGLVDRLVKDEASGILNWLLEGAVEWRRIGLSEPAIVTAQTEMYKEEMDIVARFIVDCCEKKQDFGTSQKRLYVEFRDYCKDEGLDHPMGAQAFATVLREKGFRGERLQNGKAWVGIKPKSQTLPKTMH